MLFNSLEYLLFLGLSVFLFYLIPHRLRWILLLAASYYFYMSREPRYAVFLAVTTLCAYLCVLGMHRVRSVGLKKLFLGIGLAVPLGLLFFLKYFTFADEIVRTLFGRFDLAYPIPVMKILLPIGISFYTFKLVSCLVDIFREELAVERHLGYFALYVSFFPTITAGPIDRAGNLIPQFHAFQKWDMSKIFIGVSIIAWGLFKKLVIANSLAFYVDKVYAEPFAFSGITYLMATVFYALQIYCDFSGYSDIAVGSAYLFGYRLLMNFSIPFHAATISEFWRRWHISLSSWLSDYLYTPLVTKMRDHGKIAVITSLLITFIACGLWHGAQWTFIFFGLMHGIGLSFEALTGKSRRRLSRLLPEKLFNPLSIFLTFCFVSISLIFFRAPDMRTAFHIISHLGSGLAGYLSSLRSLGQNTGITEPILLGSSLWHFIIAIGSILLLECMHWAEKKHSGILDMLEHWRVEAVIGLTIFCCFACILFGNSESMQEFIYFKF